MLNETLFHPEDATFRATTGSTYNIPNAYGEIVRGSSFPRIGTIPEAVVREGTYLTTGKNVRGTNSQFTKLNPGDFLYNGSVVRQIDYITSDTLMVLREAFPSDVGVALTVRVCNRQFYKMIYAKNIHASDNATLQESILAPNDVELNGGAPIAYDATYGQISFSLHR